MKNHIIFKFIAVLLCAASLLGAVGSAAGILLLTDCDLYNKTVDQLKKNRIQESTQHYSESLALMYTSTELGNCPEAMMQNSLPYLGFEDTFATFGYTITDAEGKVLSNYHPELADSTTSSSYTFPVSGQYMHLVSLESAEEIAAREAAEQAARTLSVGEENPEIPAEGISLSLALFTDREGNAIYEAICQDNEFQVIYHYEQSSIQFGVGSQLNRTGFLLCNPYGQLIYNSFGQEGFEPLPETEIYGLVFANYNRGFEFRLQEDHPIGELHCDGDLVFFVSIPLVKQADEETVPFTEPVTEPVTEPTLAETTVPETTQVPTEETVFPTEATISVDESENSVKPTVAEEIQAPTEQTDPAQTTSEETVPSSASAVPEETSVAETTFATETTEVAPTVPGETVGETLPPETIFQETLPAETIPPETFPEETIPPETFPEETEPVVLINGKRLEDYQINTQHYYDDQYMVAKYIYLPMPELEVTIYVEPDSMANAAVYDLLASLRAIRGYLLPAVGICLLLFAVFTVYLCTAAGRKPRTEEVRAGGLNRLPLDLYLCGGSLAIACIAAVSVEATQPLLSRDFLVGCGFAAAAAFAACLIFVGFCFAFVAQLKTPGGFWWRNTLCGHSIRTCLRFALWLEKFLAKKAFPRLCRMGTKLWNLAGKGITWTFHSWEKAGLWLISRLGCLFQWLGEKLHRIFAMIPLIWQWILSGMALFFMIFIAANSRSTLLILLCFMGAFTLIFYGAHCFGILLESTKKMAKGDLNSKVDDKLMIGCYEEFASDLNDLAGVAVVAAQKQLKSERMKTELITNVSHDIKTPLTSIINYVDLLQKSHTPEEEAQYLEVLNRQSQRLKKLIDDLMDMSKASTGNMTVDIEQVDAVESVNQALGEFADKLNRANLIPVFRHEDAQLPMMADGRLVWRVLSNILSNAVKYAMPGTRLYIDLMTLEGKVVLSLKNISRDELNIDAEELMERFVRGDDSRNTEGSGLGLNIAKSLMELQKGQLQLLVDGDLFKVTLIFPGV